MNICDNKQPYVLASGFLPWLLVMVWMFASCNEEKPKPINLISEGEMVEVLVELHLAEARMEVINIPQDSIRPLLKARYAEIFKDLEVDSSAFNQTFSHYEQDPKQMDLLYEKVVNELVARETKYRIAKPDSAVVE